MRKFISWTMALVLSLTVSISCKAEEQEVPSMRVDCKAAVLMEPYTGKILLEQNPHEKLPPASVTKVMTILLIYEAISNQKIKWEDMVTVSQHAASMGGSQIFLEPMEQQPVRELTKSIVVASANDAAVAMAEFIAGSEDGFVTMMNNKARELGMDDTNFLNACGLDTDGHVTSAMDIAIMTKELITKYPDVYAFSKIWMDSITHRTARGEEVFGLSNTNRLIRSYQGATGLKTGSTSQALYCISATAQRNNMNLIAVVLGAPDPNVRFHEAMKMFDYGFANVNIVQGEAAGTEKGTVKIQKGEKEEVNVVIKEQINVLIPRGKSTALDSKAEIMSTLNAPIKEGTKAGEIVYFFEDKEVGRSDLIVPENIKKASFATVSKRLLRDWMKY